VNTTPVAHRASLNRLALSATLHCLTGCSIGEVAGMVIGTALGFGNWSTIALSVVLAFVFGYLLTMLPLLRSGVALRTAIRLAFASDTVSIIVMEIVDNAVVFGDSWRDGRGVGVAPVLGQPRVVAIDCRTGRVSGRALADLPESRSRRRS
jgi:hypothetical protein